MAFRNELVEDATDDDGYESPYMLYGDESDLIERFDKVLSTYDTEEQVK